MSGCAIVGAVLRADAGVIALIPADRIKAAKLPDGVILPALLVRTVSVVEQQLLKKAALVRTTERVSVTVRAANYRDQVAVMKAVGNALRGRTGEIEGYARVAILTAGTGPDVLGPGDSFEQTRDFRVSFDAAT